MVEMLGNLLAALMAVMIHHSEDMELIYQLVLRDLPIYTDNQTSESHVQFQVGKQFRHIGFEVLVSEYKQYCLLATARNSSRLAR